MLWNGKGLLLLIVCIVVVKGEECEDEVPIGAITSIVLRILGRLLEVMFSSNDDD
jgi:hypothetical protein